jgi:hypothetical protein
MMLVRGQDMGQVAWSGIPCFGHEDCQNQIEPENYKVCQVIVRKRLLFEVGVNQAQAGQSDLPDSAGLDTRQKDAFCVAHDDLAQMTGSVHEHSYLAVYLSGDAREFPVEFMGGDTIRGNTTSVKMFQRLYLGGPQSGCIAEDSLDCLYLDFREKKHGAGDGGRTRAVQLGKLAFYL